MNAFRPELEGNVDEDKIGFTIVENSAPEVIGSETTLKRAESGEETIRRVLSSYDIGQKLRQLRLRKKIALTDLGKHTGLSASMLSQLENGKLIPTLPTLARIAMVFDVGLDHFFGEKRQHRTFSIVRAEDRLRFPEIPESPVPGYFFEVLSFGAPQKAVSAYLAEFPERQDREIREHFHEGSEFIYVLDGVLAINYQSEQHILRAGDSVYFDASEMHSYCGQADPPAHAVVVTVPPRL
jgi:transcriptional regulator with XRE-family HTH domain